MCFSLMYSMMIVLLLLYLMIPSLNNPIQLLLQILDRLTSHLSPLLILMHLPLQPFHLLLIPFCLLLPYLSLVYLFS